MKFRQSLEKYVHHYNTSWLKLQETSPELSSYEDRALYSTWNISYEHICSQNESAGKLLKLWGYFDNQDLWYSILARGKHRGPKWFSDIISDELSFNTAIMLLRDHALIESYGTSDGYGMHNCVHAWIKYVLNFELDISMIDLSLNCVARAVPSKTDHGYWAIERRLLPHGNRCFEVVHNDIVFNSMNRDHVMHDVHRLGSLFLHQGKLNEAENMYLRALKGKEKTYGFDHASTLKTINNLGLLYHDQRKMIEAQEMLLRALKGKEKAYGFEHTSTLDTVNNLGVLYGEREEWVEAEQMYLQALEGYEKALGFDHTRRLDTVYNLGLLYKDQGNLIEAERMLLRALAGSEKAFGFEHKKPLDTRYSLALLYEKMHQLEDAMEQWKLAAKGYTKILGPDHWESADALKRLERLRRRLMEGLDDDKNGKWKMIEGGKDRGGRD